MHWQDQIPTDPHNHPLTTTHYTNDRYGIKVMSIFSTVFHSTLECLADRSPKLTNALAVDLYAGSEFTALRALP
jgi:hypothetical protein